MAGGGFVAVLVVHLHFPQVQSLKGKRRELQRVKAQLHGRLGATVAETDHHELWQRSTLTAALAARTGRDAQELADCAERWLHANWPEGVRIERLVRSLEDLRDIQVRSDGGG